MVSVRLLTSAVATSMLTTAAFAADMGCCHCSSHPINLTYDVCAASGRRAAAFGRLYLRGNIGIGITSDANLQYLQNRSTAATSPSGTRRWRYDVF